MDDAHEDEVWLDDLWRQHRPDVMRFLARLVKDQNVIDELAQQTFVEAWCARDHRPAKPLPWLYRVARNLVYDHWRDQRRLLVMWRKLLADPLSDDGGIGLTELNGDVSRAWRTLKGKDRQCLQLSLVDGLTDDEIAAVMQIKPDNVRQRRHRARDKLRAALAEMDDRRAGSRSAAGGR